MGADLGWNPSALGLADLNRDGLPDAVVTLSGESAVMVLVNSASGFKFYWEDPTVFFGVGDGPVAVAFGDLNNDKNMDAVVANSGSDDITVLLNNYTPIAYAQTVNPLEDQSTPITLRGSAGPLDYWLVSGPQSGTLSGAGIAASNTASGYLVLATNVTDPVVVNYLGNQDYYGKDSFTFAVYDGVKTSAVAKVTLNVQPVNDAPGFTLASNLVSALEGSKPVTVAAYATGISKGPANESAQSLTFTLTPADIITNLFAAKGSPTLDSKSGNLKFTLSPEAYGTGVVSVVLKDNGGTANGGVDTASSSFTLAVARVPEAPVISALAKLTMNEGGATNWLVSFTDETTPNDQMVLTAAVSQATGPNAFPNGVITDLPTGGLPANGYVLLTPLDWAAGQWQVTVVPTPQAFGKVTVTLGGVNNDGLAAINRIGSITINAINDAPSFTVVNSPIVIGNTTTNNSVAVAANIDVGDGNTFETNQVVKFYVASDSNAGLFKTAPSVSTAGVMTFVIKGGTNVGTATLSIYPKDNGGTMNGGVDTGATQTVVVTITNVFDVPAAFNVTASGLEDTVIPVTLKGTNYDAFDATLDPGLTFQVVSGPTNGSLNVSSVETTNHYPVVNYTPNANANGTDMFTYQVYNVNYTSALATATITIKPVNDAPTFTLSSGRGDGDDEHGSADVQRVCDEHQPGAGG